MFGIFKKWRGKEDGTAAVEAAFVFPIMVTMMMGIIDVGNMLLVNKKLISASQIAADLIARENKVDDDQIDNAISAARQALMPYDTTSFGIDIVGIRFTGSDASPTEEWRDTLNMDGNNDVLAAADGLGEENEGVVAVTVVYEYVPPFSSVAVGTVTMQEVAFLRGRDSPFVNRE